MEPYLLVAPGTGPLHLTPGVPDAHQLGHISSVDHLQATKQNKHQNRAVEEHAPNSKIKVPASAE